ncbi:Rrf2 family transcriptional regulator [[Clostridium] scindens]|uniref:Rrf2 family transcriptional regulator n=1 Tax=Clostridium scindens (strain JCM 10418 / VPI 12708) TaxID=29347 RepID=UPI00298CD727|nr:Rrf2 family transcriptional regulator [[Clostridium] scindens]
MSCTVAHGYVLKVASILKKAQILEAVTRIDGGLRLVKHPRDIHIYGGMRAIETTMQINRCLETDYYCSQDAVPFCQVRHFYEKIQSYLDDMMKSASIQHLLEME